MLLLVTDSSAPGAPGAGLTATYNDQSEPEVVTTDASVFAMNVTGGSPGSSADGTVIIKVSADDAPLLLCRPTGFIMYGGLRLQQCAR